MRAGHLREPIAYNRYLVNLLHGLYTHQGPILTVANWSGQWPGLVGMLNLNGSLTKAGNGRGAKPGRALVQTYLPEHPLMQALKKGDRDSYLNQEKAIRENAGLPPYGRLAAIILSGGPASVHVEGAPTIDAATACGSPSISHSSRSTNQMSA